MITYEFDKSVSYWVGLTSHLFGTSLNTELAGTGVTLRQVQVLSCLALYNEITQSEIADLIGIEPSTLVRILDRMARDGWIERRPSTHDRRKKIIQPTEKVKAKWSEIVACGERMEKRAIKGLSETQLQNLKETLAIIRKNLEAET